jgi:hypothetical protein
MPAIGNTGYTFVDHARRTAPDGGIDTIMEVLSQTNPILQDAVVLEGNLPTGHRTTMRTGLPQGTWRQLNQGVQPSKSTTVQVTDTVGMLETYAEIDKDLANLNGNSAEFRASEDMAFLEGLSQQVAQAMIYGDTRVSPERFMGLAPRFSSLSAQNGNQIVNAAGSTARTSIWMVRWSPSTLHAIFPKGSTAGFQRTDLGEDTKVNPDGSMLQVLRTHYQWKVGMSLRDWRFVSRIANIDSSALASAGNSGYSGPNLITLMIEAYNRLFNHAPGVGVIYCNRTVKAALDKIAQAKSNVWLTIGEYAGQPTTMFYGYPIRVVDAIVNNEAAVA